MSDKNVQHKGFFFFLLSISDVTTCHWSVVTIDPRSKQIDAHDILKKINATNKQVNVIWGKAIEDAPVNGGINPLPPSKKTDKRNIELKKSTAAFLVWGKLGEETLVKGKAE